MTSSHTSVRALAGIVRIALYYILLAGLTLVLVRYLPVVREAFSGADLTGLGGPGAESAFGPDAAPPVGSPLSESRWSNAILATVSMLGALAIMVPVTWVYMLTRRHRGYHESVVHTLLILPVAVTGIVMIVKSSVALAFSLAGIVAAVRFRTTLEDTKDAVYVFLAIGVGLASGVQAGGVALAISIVFNAVVLVLWRTRFGNIYADRRTGSLGLGDVLAGPESALSAIAVGDASVLEAASPADLAEIADRAVRMERHISEERAKKKTKRANALLLVHATSAEGAQARVEPMLDELAARWKLAELTPSPQGLTLTYLARLDGPAVEGALMDRIDREGGEAIRAAELRSLKGIRPRA
ncbi:MAG TPA: DUF4956 domain-containing protein [Longimicrobiales bacterium]|nr:DUF4956 domain-containing protein [Longimicrobiales bacterium]